MSNEKKQLMIKRIITTIGLLAAIYQIIATKFILFPTDLHKSIHLTFCLVIVFLMQYKVKKKWYGPGNLITIIGVSVALLSGFYIHTQYFVLIDRLGKLNQFDLLIGGAMIIICLIATWRDWGWTIPVIVLAAMGYALFGQYLPGSWFHAGVSLKRLIGTSTIYMSGIYGSMLRISSLEVVMFIMYGAVLEAAGGGELFMKLARSSSKRMRSGVAQVAVIGSALFGTISGNIAANVATTGSITIPSMKKAGLSPELAGAIEAVASTGGQLMPPVMGVAAFLIVGISGIPYTAVMKAALFPAIAYYLYVGIAIQIRACNKQWKPPEASEMEEKASGNLLANYWHVFLSFIVLILCLSKGMAAVLMANYITVTLLAATTVRIIIAHVKDPDGKSLPNQLKDFFLNALPKGIITCSKLTVSICTLGILVEVFTMTGFAQTFAFNMVKLAGNSLFVLTLLVFVTCTFFGMGMTATSAYLLVAMLGVPAMINFGVPTLAAHLFCFYFGIMSAVTPPVARAVLVANGMSGGSFWKTAGHAVRLALPGFLLPFYFVFEPEILWYETSFLQTGYLFIVVMCGLISLSAIFENYYIVKLSFMDRLILLGILICSFWPESISNFVAIVLFAAVTGLQFLRKKKHDKMAMPRDLNGFEAI